MCSTCIKTHRVWPGSRIFENGERHPTRTGVEFRGILLEIRVCSGEHRDHRNPFDPAGIMTARLSRFTRGLRMKTTLHTFSIAAALVVITATARAQAPVNDEFTNATVIPSL